MIEYPAEAAFGDNTYLPGRQKERLHIETAESLNFFILFEILTAPNQTRVKPYMIYTFFNRYDFFFFLGEVIDMNFNNYDSEYINTNH